MLMSCPLHHVRLSLRRHIFPGVDAAEVRAQRSRKILEGDGEVAAVLVWWMRRRIAKVFIDLIGGGAYYADPPRLQ